MKYEYECPKCGAAFSWTTPIEFCPVCAGRNHPPQPLRDLTPTHPESHGHTPERSDAP